MVYEYFGFGFDVSDGSTVVGHCFIWRVGIRSTVQTLDNFPHIWATRIRHCVLKEIFPTFCLCFVDSLGDFKAIINPLLSVLMGCPTKAISSMDFGSHVWSHPIFRFLARFCFPDVDIQRDKFGSLGRLFIFDSTSFVKHDQLMPLRCHLAAFGTTGW